MANNGITVSFSVRSSKKNKQGLASIGAVIHAGGERVYVATGKFVKVSDWNTQKQCVKGNSEEADLLNQFLVEYRNNIYRKEVELVKRGYIITASILKNAITNNVEELKQRTLLTLLAEHNKEKRKLVGISISKDSLYCYEYTERLLKEFIKAELKRDDIYLHELNLPFIERFHNYLLTETGMKQNTTTKHLKFLKKIVNDAVARGELTYNKLSAYKVERNPVNPVFLTEEELRKFINFDSNYPHLEKARDIFLFSCFTGLSYIDIKTLTPEHLERDEQGRLWIKKCRVKTGVLSRIPVLPMAKMLMEKYRYNDKNVVMPIQDISDINKNIKCIAVLCGIEKHIVFHSARHTFATTVTLSNNISLEVISKMLGHTNTRMTSHYAKLLDKCIAEQMDSIKDVFKEDEQ